MPMVKLFKDNTQRHPDHEIDTSEFPGPPPGLLNIANTGKYYVFAHMLAGSGGDLAYFEVERTDINFALSQLNKEG